MIIGLDGATFDIIRPMAEAGRLPAISELMLKGTWGNLRSTVLPVTPPAWASFMTGRNPGKHGVYGFYSSCEGTYETQMVTGRSVRAKKIWNYLDDERIGLIDIPMTYPPEKINGYMISGWPVPSDMSIFTHPPELHTEIIREVGEYMIDKTFSSLPRSNPIEALNNLYRYTTMREDAALYLLKNKGPFDLFAVVFRGTDFIQHEAFKFFDESYCKANPEISAKFKDLIFQFYERIDSIVARLITAMGEDAVTIIMSDHGAGPMKKRFYINRWLRTEGFLSLKGVRFRQKGLTIGRKPLNEVLQRRGASFLNRFIPSAIRGIKVPYPGLNTIHPSSLIDWRRTRAFANLTWTDGLIRINMKGKGPQGIVEQKDYDRVRDDIIVKLLELKDPETGEMVIQNAFRKEEIYRGPYLSDAPDIMVLTMDTSYVFSPALDDGVIFERPADPAPAPHRMEGVFIAGGPEIKGGQVLSGLNITDIAPTVLYLMGRPVPDGMDGRVISEALEEGYLKKNPPAYYEEGDGDRTADNSKELSEEEKRVMEEGLRALGYME